MAQEPEQFRLLRSRLRLVSKVHLEQQLLVHNYRLVCLIDAVAQSIGKDAPDDSVIVCVVNRLSFDNAVAESFFATYKKELIHTRPWNDLADVTHHTFLWIEGYYNRRRRHSTLNYLTPCEYELGYRQLTDLAA
ncbi:MAG: transposase [Pseudonocardiales bacterium]|nr:transposase [Pseudonocardiales bacterium]